MGGSQGGEVTLSWVGPGGEELQRLPLDPDAFCAWSAPGTATGGLVFGHYGRPQDLARLRARGAAPAGNLLLVRMGRGTPAEKGPGRPPRPPALGGPGGVPPVPAPPGGRRLRLRVGGGTRPGTLTSVFGALRGRLEPDCYVIVGAQRDSLGPGAAASGVGTALLLELARFFAAIGREGFRLRRTLLFASWDGGEFGHLGATEWLEGYPGLLHTKVAAYISLDRAVLGADRLVVRASPTLGTLVESALEQV
ncbi:transferrin receptor protein 2, partial [Lonchura striata]